MTEKKESKNDLESKRKNSGTFTAAVDGLKKDESIKVKKLN
jgi:hypothetical protein